MNKTELDLSILKRCIDTLKNCTNDYKNAKDETTKEYISDACVKRFEYTVETSWKMMKKFLKLEYGKTDKELTMNNIFRLMEGYGFIKSWEAWRNYYDKRNDTSHEYNKEKAQEIFQWVDQLAEDSTYLFEKLEKALES